MVPDDPPADPRCPECGGPIAASAATCFHCAADLVGVDPVSPEPADADGRFMGVATATGTPVDHPLDPSGAIDDTLTVIVGIVGGCIIGLIATFIALVLTAHLAGALLGLVAWLGSTAYLVRRHYLLDAVAKTAYGIAAVVLLVPTIAVIFEGTLYDRGLVFVALFITAAIPAALAAGVGWFASRYVPDGRAVG